jgi:hypothetical protein
VADLFQTQFTEIKNRRAVQDLDNLIALLDVDGTITLVDDPTDDEIKAAREKQQADAEAAAQEAQAAADEEAAAREEAEAEAAEKLQNDAVASMPLQEEIAPPPEEGAPESPEHLPANPPEEGGEAATLKATEWVDQVKAAQSEEELAALSDRYEAAGTTYATVDSAFEKRRGELAGA